MLKASELRIGNLILLEAYPDLPRLHKVMPKDIYDIADGRVTLSAIDGIKLTPQILEKCGFEYKENIVHWANCDDDLSYWFITLPSDKQIEIFDDKSCNYAEGKSHIIEYLHQLQNLYFALTGEELSIKNLQTTN